jgi:hypothetical protein
MCIFLCSDFRTISLWGSGRENSNQLQVGTTFQAAGCSTPNFQCPKVSQIIDLTIYNSFSMEAKTLSEFKEGARKLKSLYDKLINHRGTKHTPHLEIISTLLQNIEFQPSHSPGNTLEAEVEKIEEKIQLIKELAEYHNQDPVASFASEEIDNLWLAANYEEWVEDEDEE